MSTVRLAKSTGIVSIGIMSSRVLGAVLLMVVAHQFGASQVYDAFIIAFTIPNLLRDLLAEGAMTAAFVPVFTEYLTIRTKEETWRLVSSVFNLLLIITSVITLIGLLFAPIAVNLIAPGFTGKEIFELTVKLTRMLFPFIIFMSLSALAMGILNAMGHFTSPALAPAMVNVCAISSLFLLSPLFPHQPIIGLALGTLIGGSAQFLIQIPQLLKEGVKWRGILRVRSEGVRRIIALMIPRAIGSAITQINTAVGRMLASLLVPGSISALYYAHILVQLPVSLFGVAVATVLFPTFSKYVVTNERDHLKETFSWGIRQILFLTIPASVGLIVLGKPIIEVLYERGEFDHSATDATYIALVFYAIGLIAYAILKLLVTLFYALHDTKTPVKVGVISMIVNIVLSLLLMGPLIHGGLALATSISAYLNMGILLYYIKNRIGSLDGRKIWWTFCKISALSIIMGIICKFVCECLSSSGIFIQVGISLTIGIITFLFLCKIFRIEERHLIFNLWR